MERKGHIYLALSHFAVVIAVLHRPTDCVAVNVPAKTSSLAFVHPKPPVVQQALLNHKISLVCEAASVYGNRPKVYWLKNGLVAGPLNEEEVAEQQVPAPVVTSSTRSILQIGCVTPEDFGVYTCVAESGRMKITTETQLVPAQGYAALAKGIFARRLCRGSSDPDQHRPPTILMWTRNTIQTNGDSVTLHCRTKANPPATVTWVVQHTDPEFIGHMSYVPYADKHRVLPNGDLEITDLNSQDTGNYVCTAENYLGVQRAEAFLYVARK